MKENILLMGFGDIAQGLASQLGEHYQMTGVRRRPCEHAFVETVQADISDRHSLQVLLKVKRDVIVMTLTPVEMSDEGYRQAYVDNTNLLLEVLRQQNYRPRLIVFVSSTSVYGQQQAQWVDESSTTEPTSYNGKRIIEAETGLAESEFTTCAVRFSGIYGPGRYRLIQQVIEGKGSQAEPVLYSNRIHSRDCAGILKHLIEKQKYDEIKPCYLASDCEPSPLHEVKEWLREALALPKGHLQGHQTLSRTLRSSKRCSNQALLDSGYQFVYPNYRLGYAQVLNQYLEEQS